MKKNTWVIVLAVLAAVGATAWAIQLTNGLEATGLGVYSTWGLYIVGFEFFTGIAAGSLILSAAPYLFKTLEDLRPFSRVAAYIGTVCPVVVAGLFILVDVGQPVRIWLIILSAQLTSPVLWDTLILAAYVVIGLLLAHRLTQVAHGLRDASTLRPLAWVAFVAGLLVTVTSFIFALQVAQPLWNTPAEPLSFLLCAIAAGFSFLIIVSVVLRKLGQVQAPSGMLARLGAIVAVCLAGQLILVLSEVAIGYYGRADQASAIRWLVQGNGAPFFWIELTCLVAAIACLVGKQVRYVVLGAALALFAVFLLKYNMIQAQLVNPLIGLAGPPNYSGVIDTIYVPSMIEFGVSIGAVAVGGLFAVLGYNRLGPKKTSASATSAAAG